MFDGEADPAPFERLGHAWRITELSHKPWPSGRATHGGLDGLQRLIAEHGVRAEQVTAGRFLVPPLTQRLVGRPPQAGMTVAYARLCLAYVDAVCLRRGTVGLTDFTSEALADADTLTLARRLSVIENRNPDPNALHPVRVELDLADGRSVTCDITAVLGSPARPLSPDQARTKFAACGARPVLWDAVMQLETRTDTARLLSPN